MGKLSDAPDPELEDEQAALRAERDRHKARADRLAAQVADLEQIVGVQSAVTATEIKPPRWARPRKRNTGHRATLCSVLSDTHFDEVVRPEEVRHLNAYGRTIAEMRLRRYFERLVTYPRNYLAGVEIDGAMVMLGGDIITGSIHEELAETNEDTVLGTVLHYTPLICAGIEMVAEEYGNVLVPVVHGNHGRLTKKPRAKLAARDNLDWLIGQQVAKHFASDDRVRVETTDGTDVLATIYDTTFLLTHGDQAKGGGGIGGIWPPIMRMLAKKQQTYAAQDLTFDVAVMGHWHSLITAPTQGLIVNGSLKGWDEYAARSNFLPERPQQAMWLVTPEHGVTWTAPVLVADRKAEGW